MASVVWPLIDDVVTKVVRPLLIDAQRNIAATQRLFDTTLTILQDDFGTSARRREWVADPELDHRQPTRCELHAAGLGPPG